MESSIIDLIKERFGPESRELVIEKDTYGDQGSGKNNLSPRDRLLVVFGRRVRNMDKSHEIYPKVAEFVSTLEQLDVHEPMYYWSCLVGDEKWGGWATKSKIIYCLKSQGK
ncbi:hypothetical protein [Shewanella woodyi]|uniref:hypothetical protein n=1 Tax=Shewanella woodyi TaxID=60961 RepID=UPI0007F88C16|nr:hypothetical protein [Shewanella woodyi]